MNELELSKHYLNLELNEFLRFDVDKLSKLLQYHSDLYYNKQMPIISDYEYDMLFKKLQFLEEKFDFWEKQTLKVWSDVIISSTFEKVAHSRPMISLDNTYNEEDLRDFDERVIKNINNTPIPDPFPLQEKGDINFPSPKRWGIKAEVEYMLEFKFDGLWIELIYENWKLIQAITRWNWIEWEDVTQNILTIENIPKNITYLDNLEVRWEVVMPISSFQALNKEALENWQKTFSNPRNAASGSLRLLDASITKKRNLKFFAYDLANMEEFRIKENKQSYFDTIKDLESLWFEISSYFKKCKNIESVINEIKNFWDVKSQIDFDIDWLVLKVNNINLWQEIGFTAHHPRYAIAYKFPAEILSTKVMSVDFQVWRTWTITPVANLEPIYIWGVTVKRATLHNFDEIKNLWLKIKDNIFIKRAWEVIPKVVWVISESRNGEEIDIITPEVCPSCWNILKKDEEKVRLYCDNFFACPEQIKQKIINSVSKQWLNIDWLGQEQVDLFLELWLIRDLSDIYNLYLKKEILLWIEWYKEKSVNNLLTSIENSKKQNIVNFIVALNIFWIGKQSAIELSKIITSNDDLINFNFWVEELSNLNDIWEQTAKNIYDFFNNETNKILVSKLLENINLEFYKKVEWWSLEWVKICITWSFENYSRDDLVAILESKWWKFVSSVSKATDYLLAWEKAWSKLKKATELWVKIMSLDEFLAK